MMFQIECRVFFILWSTLLSDTVIVNEFRAVASRVFCPRLLPPPPHPLSPMTNILATGLEFWYGIAHFNQLQWQGLVFMTFEKWTAFFSGTPEYND
jgi:hypothetical protein